MKAELPMAETEEGISISSKEKQLAKAVVAINLTEGGMTNCFSALHSSKDESPIIVIGPKIVTFSKDLH